MCEYRTENWQNGCIFFFFAWVWGTQIKGRHEDRRKKEEFTTSCLPAFNFFFLFASQYLIINQDRYCYATLKIHSESPSFKTTNPCFLPTVICSILRASSVHMGTQNPRLMTALPTTLILSDLFCLGWVVLFSKEESTQKLHTMHMLHTLSCISLLRNSYMTRPHYKTLRSRDFHVLEMREELEFGAQRLSIGQ